MYLKGISLLLALSLYAHPYAQTPTSASDVMAQAYSKAKKENKNVLLIFHASWCGWCRKMDKSLADTSCNKFFDDNYVIAHLVSDESKEKKHLENPGADSLKNKWGGKEQGLPYWVVLDAEGKLLADSRMRQAGTDIMPGENVGCPATEKEVLYFLAVLRKTSHLTREQLEIIQKRFRKNEM
jgi:thiol-disulfide isomerase/thioredoxin